MKWLRKTRGIRKEKKFGEKRIRSETAEKSAILRIDDWILGDLGTANPFRVVKYVEMGLKSRVMRGNSLKINS